MPIAKLTTGKGVGGLMKYLEQGRAGVTRDRASAWETNLGGQDRHDWAVYMVKRRHMNPNVQSPYLHVSVSFDPHSEAQRGLSDEQILEFGKSYLEQMQLQEHQWVMAVHRDKEHPHVHIVVNRIDARGKAYNLSFSKLRFMAGLREVEREHHLEPPRVLERPYQPERGERQRPERDGQLTWKLDAATRIGEAIEASDGTWEDFVEQLARRHMDLVLNPNGRGISFGLLDRKDHEGQPIRLKASTLGRRFRIDALKDRLAHRAHELVRERSNETPKRGRFEPEGPLDDRLAALARQPGHQDHYRDRVSLRESARGSGYDEDVARWFGGIPYQGVDALNTDERRQYLRTMNLYVASQRELPAYQRADGNGVRQALAIEADLHALVHRQFTALLHKPELAHRMEYIARAASLAAHPERVPNFALHRLTSLCIAKALHAAPSLVPLAVAALAAKDLLEVVNNLALSARERERQIEEEHRHDREWQYVQVNQHEYERER